MILRPDVSKDLPTHEISIAILPGYRGQGIGQDLLQELLRGAGQKGIKELVLQVKPDNTNAKRLYLKAGFQTVAHSSQGYEIMNAVTL